MPALQSAPRKGASSRRGDLPQMWLAMGIKLMVGIGMFIVVIAAFLAVGFVLTKLLIWAGWL